MAISKELIQNLQLGLKDVNKKERKQFEKILKKNACKELTPDIIEKLLKSFDNNGSTLIDTFGQLIVNINNPRLMRRVLKTVGEKEE